MQKQIRTPLLFLVTSMLILTGWLGITNAQEINTECKGVYSDVSMDNKMCPYTEYLYHQEVASGNNGEFMPDDGINRGQVAKIIMNAFQIPEDLSGDEFPDVSSSHTFYKHIMSLKNAGVLSGYPDGEFKPDNEVTRAQMMKLVINAMNFPETGIISTGHDGMAMQKFSDLHSNHSLFRFVGSAYIATVNEEENKKIIKGYPDGTFKPDQSMKRAEVAKVVTNSMKFGEFENVSCEEWFCGDLGNIFLDHKIFIAERIASITDNKIQFTTYDNFKESTREVYELNNLFEDISPDFQDSVDWFLVPENHPQTFEFAYNKDLEIVYFFINAQGIDSDDCPYSLDSCVDTVLHRLVSYDLKTKEFSKVYDFVNSSTSYGNPRPIIALKDLYIYKNNLYYWRYDLTKEYNIFKAEGDILLESIDLQSKSLTTYFGTTYDIDIWHKERGEESELIILDDGVTKIFDFETSKLSEFEGNNDAEKENDQFKEFQEENVIFISDFSYSSIIGINENSNVQIFKSSTEGNDNIVGSNVEPHSWPYQSFNRLFIYFQTAENSPPTKEVIMSGDQYSKDYDMYFLDTHTGKNMRKVQHKSLLNEISLYDSFSRSNMYLWSY